jgi:hypothetical protein
MAGTSGNVATFGWAKQSAKGTAAAASIRKTKFTGGDFTPQRSLTRLAETAGTRDQGPTIMTAASVSGNPSCYLRSSDFSDFAYYALGANADSGAGPYVHTATPVQTDLPYVTLWKMVAATSGALAILERYEDCKLNTLRISGSAGNPLTVEMEWLGLRSLFLGTNDATAVTTVLPVTWDMLAVTKGGAAKSSIQSFDLTITNNLVLQQGNGAITAYDIFPGEFQVSGTMTLLFESNVDYLQFHYGTATAPSGASTAAQSRTLFQEALVLTLTQSASSVIAISLANVTYTAIPVAPDPGGAPIVSAMAFNVEPGSPTVQIATTNTNATAG